MIHVCYSLHDGSGGYAKLVGTSMVSIFENTDQPTTIHIFHDKTLTEQNRQHFIDTVRIYGQDIALYNMDEIAKPRVDEIVKYIPKIGRYYASIGTFFRLLIPNFLPKDANRAIYLDADVLVNRDINDLWTVELGDKSIAAHAEKDSGMDSSWFHLCKIGVIPQNDYFNAGVILFDLNKIREEKDSDDLLTNCLKILHEHPDYPWLDQDALNVVFLNKTEHIPSSFNHMIKLTRNQSNPKIEREIYHYVSDTLQLNMHDIYNRLWFEYFVKSPFCTPSIFRNLESMLSNPIGDYKRQCEEKINRAKRIASLSIERPRTFFMNPDDAKKVPEMFGIRGNEFGINSNAPNSLDLLLDRMKSSNAPDSNDKRIYFISVEPKRYDEIRNRLVSEGFKEDEDFTNFDGLFSTPNFNLPAQNFFVRRM